MTRQEARLIAESHLERFPLPGDSHRWVLPEGLQSSEGWVFKYKYDLVKASDGNEGGAIGGAPAFVVHPNGVVRNLAWKEFKALTQLVEGNADEGGGVR